MKEKQVMICKEILHPVLKWAGGKRQHLNTILSRMPASGYDKYYEPFIGGGAVLLKLQPQKAVINDTNYELINVYRVIREYPNELIQLLVNHTTLHSTEYYYRIRSLDRNGNYNKLDNIQKAARMIYLNKTCYNGLYRVNNEGQFNTPIGRYSKASILDVTKILSLNNYLLSNEITITCEDFYETLKGVTHDDFVYLDPPYDPVSLTSSFTNYTKLGFSRDDQIRLKTVCDELTVKGVRFLESNSNNDFIRELYKDYKVTIISASRYINSKYNDRKNASEVIITNY